MKHASAIAFVLGLILGAGFSSPVLAQSVSDWTVEAPFNSVQLVKVESGLGETLNFTFKNISDKSIIYSTVWIRENHCQVAEGTGINAFLGWKDLVAPGESFTARFSKSNLINAEHTLRVTAVLYSDGTEVGDQKELETDNSELFGMAIEIKRDTEFLSASSDPGVSGFDAVVEKIGNVPPGSDPNANELVAASVRGVSLEGIPQSEIESHLNHPGSSFATGVIQARQQFLLVIQTVKSNATLPESHSKKVREYFGHLQSQGLADLAKQFNTACEMQAQYLRAFWGISKTGE